MHLKAEGLISEIRWTRREGKRVIDFIVAKCPNVDKKTQNCAAPANKKKVKPAKPKKKPSTAFDLLLKNRDLPPPLGSSMGEKDIIPIIRYFSQAN